MSVSANADYVDWLVGRNLGERDRAPAHGRLKTIFVQGAMAETGKKVVLPHWEGI
jgi:hypothetical protein